jgi:hypothetical protein
MSRAILIHHEEMRVAGRSWDWCGLKWFVSAPDDPVTPEDEQRIEERAKSQADRPIKHCPKCVRNKKRAHPDWEPKEIPATYGEFCAQAQAEKGDPQ